MEKLLPVGTVVRMKKKDSAAMMILGFYPQIPDEDELYDYVAVIYPQGIINDEAFFLIKHEDISEIIFKGYEDEKAEAFLKSATDLFNSFEK